jgi:hypothetical protein
MKRGRPAKSQDKPARQSRTRSAKRDGSALARGADPDSQTKTSAKKSAPRKGLLALLAGQWLSSAGTDLLKAADRTAIRAAFDEDITVQHLAAIVSLELTLARRLHAAGEIDGKDLIVAIGKASTHAAAVAQLAVTKASQQLPSKLVVEFSVDGAPSAADIPGRERVARAPVGDCGDPLDVET